MTTFWNTSPLISSISLRGAGLPHCVWGRRHRQPYHKCETGNNPAIIQYSVSRMLGKTKQAEALRSRLQLLCDGDGGVTRFARDSQAAKRRHARILWASSRAARLRMRTHDPGVVLRIHSVLFSRRLTVNSSETINNREIIAGEKE